jgi:hypothetical protein
MSHSKEMHEINLHEVKVISSVPATYTNAAHVIFTIQGGPILIYNLIEYLDTALGGATQTRLDVNGIFLDAGAVAINAGGIGASVVSPLSAARAKAASAVNAFVPNVAAATAIESLQGVVAPIGTITWTFSVVAMGALERVSLHMVYRLLSDLSRVY